MSSPSPHLANTHKTATLDSPNSNNNYNNNHHQNNATRGALIYASANFQYNRRFLFLILLALPSVLSLAGKYSLLILIFGLITIYIFDFLHRRLYSFLAFWFSLVLFWLSLYLSYAQSTFITTWNHVSSFSWSGVGKSYSQNHIGHSESFLITLNIGVATFFIVGCGLYGSMQFLWFKQWIPKLLVFTEQFLFETFPIVAMPLILESIVSTVGMRNAPFYLMLVCLLLVHWFVKPQASSFLVPNEVPSNESSASSDQQQVPTEVRLQDPKHVQVLSVVSFISPCIMYLLLYCRMLEFSLYHMFNLLALLALPTMFFLSRPNQYLWWLTELAAQNRPTLAGTIKTDFNWNRKELHRVRVVILCLCAFLLALFFEYRVIFMRYPYLIALRPPFNYIVVTLGMMAGVGILGLVVNGNLGSQGKLGIILLCSATTAITSFVLGFNIMFIPIPTIAAYCGTSFYFTKSWKQYYVFGVAASISVLAWLLKSFWFLYYEFDTNFFPMPWSVTLTQVIYLMTAFFALCVALIPLLVHSTNLLINGIALAVHASLLAFIEQLFYDQEESFYPSSLIFITSALGVGLMHHLFYQSKIDRNWASIGTSIYFSKVAVFLDIRMAMIATLLTSGCFTRIYFAYISKERISQRIAWMYIALSGFFLFLTRGILTARCIEFFFDSHSVSTSRTFGLVILVWGIGILPLTYSFLPNVVKIRKFNVLLLIVGGIWAFLQPMLHVSSSEMSAQGFLDANHTTGGILELFVPWIFMAVCIGFVGTSFKVLPMPKSKIGRLTLFVFFGLGAGISFTGTYLLYCGILVSGAVCLAFLASSLVIYNAHFPMEEKEESRVGMDIASKKTDWDKYRPYMLSGIAYAVLCISLPLALILARFTIPTPQVSSGSSLAYISSSEIFEGCRTSLLGVCAILHFFVAVVLKFKLIGRPLLSKRLTEDAESSSSSSSGTPMTSTKGISKQEPNGALAAICNLATLQGFTLGIVLTALLRNPLYAYIALSPLLLLLAQDDFVFRHWSDTYRYTLVLFIIEGILLISFFIELVAVLPLIRHATLLFASDMLMSILTVPSFILLNLFFTNLKRPDVKSPLIALVPSIVAWALASMESVKISGQIGAAGCFLLLFTNQLYSPLSAKREV